MKKILAGLGIAIAGGVAIAHMNVPLKVSIYPTVKGAINPNITQANIKDNICNPNWSTSSIRPSTSYTDKIKVNLMKSENLQGTKGDYELDHLISLELGGSPTSLDNLWMQAYNTTVVNGGARSKDKVEDYLHTQVCKGTITLAEAQHEIVTDWYAVLTQIK